MEIAKSMLYFLVAGIFEIGGGYLIWLYLREGKGVLYGIVAYKIDLIGGFIALIGVAIIMYYPRG